MVITKQNNSLIHKLCKSHSVDKLYLFGSATGDAFNRKSDIDFLVTFKQIDLAKYFANYIDLKKQLKTLFSRDIDLLESQSLKNPILIKSINKSKKLIYG